MIKLKIIVAGAKAVGKTSLIRRFCTGKFQTDTLSTIGVDFMTKNVKVNDVEVHFSIWDFAGEHKFRQLFPAYCSGASGAFILFDITNKDTFLDLEDWTNLLSSCAAENIIKILIASKIDLEDKREISDDEALEFLKQKNLNAYIKTSAKTGVGVEEAFKQMAKLIIEQSLIKCPSCNELIPKELIFCTYCGEKVKNDE
ncbi:MAG: GTP-binding protein [Promethearchaeota archaeon]